MPGETRSPPIRLLVNAIHARAGGGVTYLRHLLPLLAAEPDLAIEVLPHPEQAANLMMAGIRVHEIWLPKSWLGLLLWEQLVLPWKARRIGFDLLLSPANFGPLLVAEQVLVLQNALGVGALERRWRKRLYWAALALVTRLSLHRARRAIAVSRYVAASAGTCAATIIPHGVDDAFTPDADRADARFLLAVGDLYIQKNLHALLDAFQHVAAVRPELDLRIAGAAIDEEYAAQLARQVQRLGLGDRVRFLGRVPQAELIELYRSCAIFVFPSLEESFGMPLLEAMACGAPIVAADRAAMPEIAGDAALLVDAGSPRSLADAVLHLLDDAGERRRLGERAVARARTFTWQECARRTAALLRDAARRTPSCAA